MDPGECEEMASEKKSAKSEGQPSASAASGAKLYLIQQGKEMFVQESASYPDLTVDPGQKLKKVIAASERRDVIDRVIARQEAEGGLTLRS